jgi:malate dehydrogenase (oxaloacetate-decarboxylating)
MPSDRGAVVEQGRQGAPIAAALLNRPIVNKGTAFTEAERARFGLNGLLPPYVETLEGQALRAYEAFRSKPDTLERHIYLRALQDMNEVLFYRLVLEHLEEMLPIVYTPVVAQGCRLFSHIYRRPRGLFLSYPLRTSIRTMLASRPHRQVDVVLVTDGERVLGIGDQGVGGMGISIGKLSLHTAIGGVHPARTLPVVLDVGTDNADRLNDPEYLGWRHSRIAGQDYFDFVEAFVDAVRKELPDALIHWEDFATVHARTILSRYRDELLTYNDDIQGTAAVTLGTIMGAAALTGSKVSDQRVVFLGAGSAVGVADYLRAAMVAEGLEDEAARRRVWMVDIDGLLHTERTDLTPDQRAYAQPLEATRTWARASNGPIGLADVIANTAATVLVGLSTAAGAFTESIVREMARKIDRPLILPLSTPQSEATPGELLQWTEGRALVATGSPFPPVHYAGQTIPIAQCNNVYIFPGIGLGVAASRARRVSDAMILAAARTLGECSPALRDPAAPLLPPLSEARGVAVEIAVAVGEAAQREGIASTTTRDQLRQRVRESQWTPQYADVEL